MPFTDNQLGQQMAAQLVADGLMTAAEQQTLLENPTEYNVADTLTTAQLNNFQQYWANLGVWLTGQGGNIAATTGNNVPGRVGGNPTTLQLKALYNDAFRDVNHYLNQPSFDAVKAVTAQLRFIKNV